MLIEYKSIIYPLENIQIARDHANYTVSGVQSRLIPNEVRKYNLNADQYYDLVVTFTKNYVNRIELRLEPTNELEPAFNILSLPPGLENWEPKAEPVAPPAPEVQPEPPVVAEPPESREVEVKAEVKGPGFFSRLSSSLKGITGSVAADIGSLQPGGWMIALLVVVFGVVLYFFLVEMFDW